MGTLVPHYLIYLILLVTVVLVYWICQLGVPSANENSSGTANESLSFSSTWLYRLIINLLTYSTVLIPGYVIFRYVKATKLLERSAGNGPLLRILRACFEESSPGDGTDVESGQGSVSGGVKGRGGPQRTLRQEALLIGLCFTGLQGTYLTWGILQEKVMTQAYKSGDEVGHFKDSQFLVFVNRILAFALSGTYLLVKMGRGRHSVRSLHSQQHSTPLYNYMYSSLSNIMSSWCQYEALKFVSFPTQVLAKASKIIPVMVMGKLVMKQKYEYYEYVTAVLISTGMAFFMLSTAPEKEETVTTLSGIILLICYMGMDSFTSNWQGKLFQQYSMSPVQMMCGVNMFSCLFTAVSLLQQGSFPQSLAFMAKFPKFTIDCLLLSISSGAGQLFIFFTIAKFGPVVFVIIMTIRQGLAILLSCLLYSHKLPGLAIFGIIIVFVAVFLRIYCNQRLKTLRRSANLAAASESLLQQQQTIAKV